MKNLNTFIFTTFLLFTSLYAQNTISSRFGADISTKDTIRVFYVFAELDNNSASTISTWQPGQIPTNANAFFDADFDTNNINGFMTKYFYQASFGQFIVLGDYYPNILKIDTNISVANQEDTIFSMLNNITSNDIITARGKSVK